VRPIIGLLAKGQALLNDGGQASLEAYLNRVAEMCGRHGFSPAGVTISPRLLQSNGQDKDEVEALREQLNDLNLRCTAGVGSLQLHAKPQLVQAALTRAIAGLEFAAALSADAATFGPGLYGRVSRYGHIRMAVEQYGRLADEAAKYGLRVCHENYDSFNADEFQWIFDACDRDNLGLLNDTGNWVITHDDPLVATQRFASRTFHVHLKDYVWNDGVWNMVPLGTGIINFPAILRELRAAPQPLITVIEMDLDDGSDEIEAQERSLAYLRTLFDEMKEARSIGGRPTP